MTRLPGGSLVLVVGTHHESSRREGGIVAQRITPNLWFNGNADEAVDFYVSVFPNSSVLSKELYPESAEDGLADFQLELAGKTLAVDFELDGYRFCAINAGPEFSFSEAVSFAIQCRDQDEIDRYWGALSSVPESEQCGWCKDRFGLSWQVLPQNMAELMKRPRAYANMMQMKKIVISDL
jgi:predicted 3-demethylubiquinone-9 3-methyltransferase (glyoxalase superfamily)